MLLIFRRFFRIVYTAGAIEIKEIRSENPTTVDIGNTRNNRTPVYQKKM